jgi:hypothetical protein
MLQLVYISTAREPVTPALVDAILAASRRNNACGGVTGLLVAGGSRFLQALEGPDQAVLDTYARIRTDPRHGAMVLLSTRTIGERMFGDWSMACETGSEAPRGSDLLAVVVALSEGLPDKNLRAQFTGFAELHARAA